MRARRIFCLTVALALCAFAPAAFGAIDGSRHDMGAMGGSYSSLASTLGDCAACHVPHKAGGEKLWSQDNVATYNADGGTVWNLCAYCHDGTTVTAAGANMDASIYADPSNGIGGHGMDKTKSVGNPGGTTLQTSVEASTLPHTNTSQYMECTSCHSVHNSNSIRPFLASGTTAVTSVNDLCERCHTNREITSTSAVGFQNTRGVHPANSDNTFSGDRSGGTTPIVLTDMETREGGIGAATDNTWTSGPKLTANTNGGVTCVSCHVVHGNDGAATIDANLLFASQGLTAANTFCEECHQGSQMGQTYWPNPGGTVYSHPADDNGARSVAITQPAWMVFGTGTPNEVMCTTCHGVHGITGVKTTLDNTPMILADNNASLGFCMDCHDSANAAFDGFHTGHIGGDGSGGSFSSMTPSEASADPIGGTGIDCYACHRAHNGSYPQMLRAAFDNTYPITADPAGICVDCHTYNPSIYTTTFTDNAALGSHYVGDPTVTTATDGVFPTNGYGQNLTNAPMKTDAWAFGYKSLYGPVAADSSITDGEKGAMNCLSCHTVKGTTRELGDDNSTRLLLADVGNSVDITSTDNSAYLCTGCHGFAPVTKITGTETGNTHPLWTATGGDNSLATPRGEATYTTSNQVNCESCHRAHDADTNSGTYILETNPSALTSPAVAAWGSVYGNSYTTGRNIQPSHAHDKFCNLCHSTY